ncbi:MAG TPA: ABC transporter permease [Roseiflexaceae bacterium]|nr:ABC transporter permease [Roseiflexaceae bacterium]HMP41956.1 ABC transporter permease [Roseiflexaceae bacterium]
MATVAEELQRSRKTKKVEDVGSIPQWKLMVRRFRQSRLSVVALGVLLVMYTLMILGDFLAPYPHDTLDSNATFTPPTQLVWGPEGLGVYGLKQELDTEKFQWYYTTDTSVIYPLKFFVPGYEYRLFAIIPMNVHLFGIDTPGDVDQKVFLWGADKEGRDLFSRVMKGAQVSLTLGFVGVLLSVTIGSIVGTASGYFGGAVDNIIQRMIELIRSFPDLPLYMALAAALPLNVPVLVRFFLITIIIALIGWTGLAREVRGKVLAFASADYTNAALAAGASHWYIITKHLIPNAMSHIIVVGMLAIPGAIGLETALSFLGLGILPPAVSWGVLLRDAQTIQAVVSYPWLLLPVACLIIAVLSFNLLGDGVRDAVDPYG